MSYYPEQIKYLFINNEIYQIHTKTKISNQTFTKIFFHDVEIKKKLK